MRAVVRREPVTAWLARSGAGQDAVFEQLDGGRPTTLYREIRPGVKLTALALLDGGRVAVVAVRTANGARTASVLLVTPRLPEPEVLVASAPSPSALAYSPALSAFGQSLAFRRRVGTERGLADQIVVLDVLRGTRRVVASGAPAHDAALRPVARLRPRRLERRADRRRRGSCARACWRRRRDRRSRAGARAAASRSRAT